MHSDLLKIEELVYCIDPVMPLTQFEKMVLVLEDRRFFAHIGFDYLSILREIKKLIFMERHGGASTIDMQLFRTVSNRYERTFRRKLREMVGVFLLQKRLNKIQILRVYLEVAYFGTGLTGARAGARSIYPNSLGVSFSPEISKLTLEQSARLASMLVYPKPRLPNTDWLAKISRRADYALSIYAGHKEKFDKVNR